MRATDATLNTESEEIPDKLYFRIGEVSRVSGVPPYVLRYWETEFPAIAPKKSGTGHRLYRRKDVELILEIKRLLYENRYTIEGARRFLVRRRKRTGPGPPSASDQSRLFDPSSMVLEELRRELKEILDILG